MFIKKKVAFLALSDIHIGEVVSPDQVFGVNKFNTKICRKRVHSVIDKFIEFISNTGAQKVVVAILGDLISGANHKDLSDTNDSTVIEQKHNATLLIKEGLLKLNKHHKNIEVLMICGNHGRKSKEKTFKNKGVPENNHEADIYNDIKQDKQLKSLKFLTTDGDNIFKKYNGRKYLFTHGDQWLSFNKLESAFQKINEAININSVVMGHWHRFHINNRMIVNGSITGVNECFSAFDCNYESPSQVAWLQVDSEIELFYKITLD